MTMLTPMTNTGWYSILEIICSLLVFGCLVVCAGSSIQLCHLIFVDKLYCSK